MSAVVTPLVLSIYLAVGFLWIVWGTQSESFQRMAADADRDGKSWRILVAIALGTLLWPVGVFAHVISKPRR